MPIGEPTDQEVRAVAAADYLREVLVRQRSLTQRDRDRARLTPAHFSESVDQVALTAVVNPHLPIAWPHWPPGVVPKGKALLQKVTRRLLAWYINPIVAQQNAFNHSVLRALQDADRRHEELTAQVTELDRVCQTLRDELAALDRPADAGLDPREPDASQNRASGPGEGRDLRHQQPR